MQRKASNITEIWFTAGYLHLILFTVLSWFGSLLARRSSKAGRTGHKEYSGPCWYRNCRIQWCNCLPQQNHRLVLTPTITYYLPIAPSTAVLPQAAQTQGQYTKDTLSNLFYVLWYVTGIFFLCLLQLSASDSWFSLHELSLMLLRSFQQLSFWFEKNNLTKPLWLLLVTLPVLRN